MNYSIIWSPQSKESFENNILHLLETWSEKEANDFIDRVEEILRLISKHPKIFTYLPEQDAFRCVIVKPISLFYRLRDNQVELLTFWDNRMDPEKINISQ
jgi:plasmid stabilization system protein ParE